MEWSALIGVVCAIGGFVIAWISFRVKQKKDDEAEGVSRGVLTSDIGYIKAGVDDLKKDNKEARGMIGVLSERVTRVEESCKQAHKRLDKYEKDD